MVAGFSRSFSLPGSPRPKTLKSYHVRSVSLPCRSHPLLSLLHDEILSVDSWRSSHPESAPTSSSSAWLCDGMARLELLHASLTDLLSLPHHQDSLRRSSAWSCGVLDNFLRLADSHGCLRSNTIAMNDHQSETQIAIRRKDGAKIESCVRQMKKTERQLVKLAASLGPLQSKYPSSHEAELVGIIKEVINVTVSASAVLLIGLAAASAAASATVAVACSSTSKGSWMSSKRRSTEAEEEKEEGWRRSAMERIREFEECVGAVEKKSERVFRCLLNTRVSLLGLTTPSL